MSRTYHHGDKAKRRAFGTNWRWQSTPGWWVRMQMTRPQRRAVKVWEVMARNATDLDRIDMPPHGKKPHLYFW